MKKLPRNPDELTLRDCPPLKGSLNTATGVVEITQEWPLDSLAPPQQIICGIGEFAQLAQVIMKPLVEARIAAMEKAHREAQEAEGQPAPTPKIEVVSR